METRPTAGQYLKNVTIRFPLLSVFPRESQALNLIGSMLVHEILEVIYTVIFKLMNSTVSHVTSTDLI